MASRPNQLTRPSAITWAAAANVANAVIGVVYAIAWPDLDERATILTVSCVLGVIFIAAAWYLYNGSRWGAIASILVNAFSILLTVPGFFQFDSPSEIVALVVSLALSIAAIVLALTPAARDYWRPSEPLAA
jgi:hypothetical protein